MLAGMVLELISLDSRLPLDCLGRKSRGAGIQMSGIGATVAFEVASIGVLPLVR